MDPADFQQLLVSIAAARFVSMPAAGDKPPPYIPARPPATIPA